MASVSEIAEALHKLIKAGLVKPLDADPMVYVEALQQFQIGVLEQAITNFIQGLYREHSTVFYPTAAQLAGYCRRVQQERYAASYGQRFDQRVREAQAAQANYERVRAENSRPEVRARIEKLLRLVPQGERAERAEIERKLISATVRAKYRMEEIGDDLDVEDRR